MWQTATGHNMTVRRFSVLSVWAPLMNLCVIFSSSLNCSSSTSNLHSYARPPPPLPSSSLLPPRGNGRERQRSRVEIMFSYFLQILKQGVLLSWKLCICELLCVCVCVVFLSASVWKLFFTLTMLLHHVSTEEQWMWLCSVNQVLFVWWWRHGLERLLATHCLALLSQRWGVTSYM